MLNYMRPLVGAAGGNGSKRMILTCRNMSVIASPPKTPLTTGETIIYGFGSIAVMMIIPIWGLYSLPRWAEIHRTPKNVGPDGKPIEGGEAAEAHKYENNMHMQISAKMEPAMRQANAGAGPDCCSA